MNYEQFFYWLQGIMEFNDASTISTAKILRKMREVSTGIRSPLGKLPDLDTRTETNEEMEKMLADFKDNFDDLPVEEDIPAVGSPIDDSARKWEKGDKSDIILPA